jgi:hypothetical protein
MPQNTRSQRREGFGATDDGSGEAAGESMDLTSQICKYVLFKPFS